MPTDGVDDAIARLDGATRWLANQGVDVVAADPEVVADGYAARLGAIGFSSIEEIQPSRHRLSVRLGGDIDEDALLENVSKSTRQRIRQAERGDLTIVRHDAASSAPSDGTPSATADLEFANPRDTVDAALGRFHDLALQTADRRHFSLGSSASFLDWTSRAYASGFLVLLEAVDEDERSIAGLMLYRHGGRLSTALSGDREDARKEHPGAFHLLRWRAIQLAVREGASEMDLGGVDVAGARHEPKEGEPMFGLYQHKRSFGAEWLELPGAHERVLRSWRYAAGRIAARLLRRSSPGAMKVLREGSAPGRQGLSLLDSRGLGCVRARPPERRRTSRSSRGPGQGLDRLVVRRSSGHPVDRGGGPSARAS